jgi:hypothetical protein
MLPEYWVRSRVLEELLVRLVQQRQYSGGLDLKE